MSVKATIVTTTDDATRQQAVDTAKSAIRAHKTVVIPTDTVYGVAADAFSVEGVTALLTAKGRSRQMPPPVLIADQGVLPGLADGVSEDALALAETFWPGALTLIFYAQPSLNWDLGETQGTVALRVPDDPTALELLRHLGPLAVSSANKTGRPAATTAAEAMEQLGEDVEVIFDGGPRPESRGEEFDSTKVLPSTIVDCTSDRLVVVREGAISVEQLRGIVPSVLTRAELEAQERAAREAHDAAEKTQAAMQETDLLTPYETEDYEEGRRAAAPESGSLAANLVSSAAAPVDQRRTASAHFTHATAADDGVKPFPVADAKSLVFGAAPLAEQTIVEAKHLARDEVF
ncbi:MAG: L-threonylcarbamoyladenylate synthase [Rothia sp. (in: high G+C Gram-positive bacteria)]|nr:L-threonylcarbamoyladenylate synthase [Rothia sp. (in: high G+C Gram-positive bacteria)]